MSIQMKQNDDIPILKSYDHQLKSIIGSARLMPDADVYTAAAMAYENLAQLVFVPVFRKNPETGAIQIDSFVMETRKP